MTHEIEWTPLKVTRQGSPIVNYAHVLAKSENVAAISIELHSKRCECTGGISDDDLPPSLTIEPTEESLYLSPVCGNTVVELANWFGWKVYCCNLARYTLSVCLVRKCT